MLALEGFQSDAEEFFVQPVMFGGAVHAAVPVIFFGGVSDGFRVGPERAEADEAGLRLAEMPGLQDVERDFRVCHELRGGVFSGPAGVALDVGEVDDVIESAKGLEKLPRARRISQVEFMARGGDGLRRGSLAEKARQMSADESIAPGEQKTAHALIMSGVRMGGTRKVSLS